MIYIDEVKNLRLYSKEFLLPRNGKDKKKNNAVFLLTPNFESSKWVINHKLIVNKYYNSYFLDKDVSLYINEGNLFRVPEDGVYVHETDSNINEGFYGNKKKEIIFNGYSSDVSDARKVISISKLEYLNSKLNAKINWPISVTVYRNGISNNVHTDSKSIHLMSYNSFSEDYELYCIEEMYKCLIHCINNDVNEYLCDYIAMVLSGGYDKYRDEIIEDRLTKYIQPCESIKNIISESNGYHKLYTIIEKNDMKKVFKGMLKNSGEMISNIFKEDTTDVKSLVRKIKMKSRKGSKYKLNKVGRNVDRTVDTSEKTPDMTSKDYDADDVGYDKISDIKGNIKSAATAPAPSNSKNESYEYDTKVYELFSENTSFKEDAVVNEDYIYCNNMITFFNEDSQNYSNTLKKILYRERLRNNKAVIPYMERVKEECPAIKYTYLSYKRYKSLNLWVDLFYYNELYFKNSMYTNTKGFNIYKDFLYKLLNNKNFENSGYNQRKVIFIPVHHWTEDPDIKMWMYTKDINPISILYKLMNENNFSEIKKIFKDNDLVFITNNNYFRLNFSEVEEKNLANRFLVLIKKMLLADNNGSVINNKLPEDDDVKDEPKNSNKAIVDNIIDTIEDNSSIVIKKNLTGDANKKEDKGKTDSEKLVEKINKAAENSEDEKEALEKLDNDDEFKKLLLSLDDASEESYGPNISASRQSRITKLDDELMDKEIKGKKIKDILNYREDMYKKKLEPKSLPVDSINEEWKELTYPSMNEQYDPDEDIIAMLRKLNTMTYPISIRDISIEDVSTSEDFIYTYNVDLEYINGKRSKLKFDVPKLKNHKYMMLRGNKKNISSQCFLMPVSKTESDTVQLVSNYNKIFIRRYGASSGKSNIYVDYIIKFFKKYNGNQVTFIEGDNSVICNRYDLPIDYVDLASQFSKIEINNSDGMVIYFNIDELKKDAKEEIDFKKGIPYAIGKGSKTVYYWKPEHEPEDDKVFKSGTFAERIMWALMQDAESLKLFESFKPSTKYTYSKASILSSDIPVIILCGYAEGLTKTLDKSGIEYEFVEKKGKLDWAHDFIKFNDGFLVYKITASSSMLLNGLKESNTEEYSIGDINKRSMYIDFIEQYGGRLKCDGLDNFYDCMIDPITESILVYKNLPTNYVELLLYANNLLVDNSFVNHGDMSGRRLRRNELIAAYAYKALSKAYGDYATSMKHGRETILSMKQSAIVDMILVDNTAGDLSIINALGEKESYDTVTYKGLSGNNSDRSYKLDKRGYDESMINVLGMSTGFAGTVGINRQATLNCNVDTVRGFIKPPSDKEMNSVNTLCMSEALTPMGTTRDDPFRSAMTYIQTTKHGMRVQQSDPLLVTNGADEALPYLISDIFAYKAKQDGTIIEKDDEHIIVEYKDGSHEYVDLTEKVEKNSSAGFYVTLKLDSDLKVGSKVKEGGLIAYDKTSFNNGVGINNNPAYNIGTLAKCVMIDTDEGFEDSTAISDDLSTAMSNDVVVAKEIVLDKNTNVYNMVKKGDPLEEGDTLLVIQTPYEEEDANMLLKNLVDDPDEISDLGRIPIKSKVTGMVQDIKIYRTVELEELSDSLQKICKDYEKDIKRKKKIMNNYKIDGTEDLDADYKLPATGKLKDTGEGVKIIFYLKYVDKMSIGDKLINWSANKGVVKYIFPKGKEPYCLSTPEEKVHCLVSIASCNGRMVTSIQNIGVMNHLLVEAGRKAKQMAGLPINYDFIRKK